MHALRLQVDSQRLRGPQGVPQLQELPLEGTQKMINPFKIHGFNNLRRKKLATMKGYAKNDVDHSYDRVEEYRIMGRWPE